jgi:uncharacterized protein
MFYAAAVPERSAPTLSLAGLSLAELAERAAAQRAAPVERWDPPHCGDSEMRIARDGMWYHQGSPIARPAMVRLFATLLRREADGSYVLVTPVEKLAIAVEDRPFTAVELSSDGTGRDRRLAFRLNTGDVVVAGAEHPLSVDAEGPQLIVRRDLAARIARSVFYELAELAIGEGHAPAGLWSDGRFFALEPA